MPKLDEEFRQAVYKVVRMIPKGQVASYGQVATYVISPRYARAVGRALKELPEKLEKKVPWHRVINAAGRVSARGELHRPVEQERRLIAEKVVFKNDKVDLRVFGWTGPEGDWEPLYEEPRPDKITHR